MDSIKVEKIIDFLSRLRLAKVAGIIFVLGLIFFSYLFLSRSSFSSSDISILIKGPETFKSQEKVNFEITLINESKFDIQGGALYVTLPEFIVFEGDETSEKKLEFGSVAKHGKTSVGITLFAKDTEMQGVIKVRAEYAPNNLQGIFESIASANVSIASLPLTVIFDLPQKAVNGQSVRGSFHFVVEKELESMPLIARIILPDNFTLRDSAPKPDDTTTWKFDKINPGESYRVEFEGVIEGYESETKNFDLLFGTSDDKTGFKEQYKISRQIRISSSPIEFTQTVNGSVENIASPGEELKFKISYKNKTGVDIEDVSISAQLIGDAFDFSTLNTGSGYFNKETDTIVWNKDFLLGLASLDKDESGNVEFSVSLKKDTTAKDYGDKNIYVKTRAIIDTTKIPLALNGLSLRAESSARVNLRTSLLLSQKAYYYEGPFSNSGPIPPKVGERTTYTIFWRAENSSNEVKDVTVEAALSRHVVFEGKVYPQDSGLNYNSSTHSLSWDLGKLLPGVGSIIPAKTVAFQVSFTPSEEMRGNVAELIEQAKISGTDVFVNEFVESFAPSIDTSLPYDGGIQPGDGIVE